MAVSNHSIEHLVPENWQRFREVRLRALADAPDAFGATLAETQARPLSHWRDRLGDTASATFLACNANGDDVGLVVGSRWNGIVETVGLFSMWVAPNARGRGIGGALVDAVIAWARSNGSTRILLDVADGNAPAIALYASRGFLPTGNTGNLPPPRDHITEHEQALELQN